MIELINEFRNVSIILDNENCDILVGQLLDEGISFIETDEYELEEMLNNEPFFIVSKNTYWDGEEEYIIEALIKEDNSQYYLENDVVIIQENLGRVVDFDVIEADEILTFRIEECEEEVEEDEKENCCEWCSGFEAGYRTAIEEMQELLGELVR